MISLALLIGGRGTRLGGADKARLVLPSGSGTAETLLRTFEPLVDEVFLVGRADQTTHPLARDHRLLVDARPDEGPLRAIAGALAAASSPWVFVVACDLVGLSAVDLDELAARRTRGRLAIAWRSSVFAEPLCALYHRALATRARRLLDAGERRATALLEGAHLVDRSVPLANLNTDADLENARASRARS